MEGSIESIDASVTAPVSRKPTKTTPVSSNGNLSFRIAGYNYKVAWRYLRKCVTL